MILCIKFRGYNIWNGGGHKNMNMNGREDTSRHRKIVDYTWAKAKMGGVLLREGKNGVSLLRERKNGGV